MIDRIGASADDIAIAVVKACRYTGEDPIAVIRRAADDARDNLGRAASSRAGFIALAALSRVCPDLKVRQCTRALGWPPSSAGDASGRGLSQARRAIWWSEPLVDKVVAAIRAHRRRPPVPEVKQPVAPPIVDLPPFRSHDERKSAYVVAPANRPDRRSSVVPTLGDPPPGRSALDQRRASEASR